MSPVDAEHTRSPEAPGQPEDGGPRGDLGAVVAAGALAGLVLGGLVLGIRTASVDPAELVTADDELGAGAAQGGVSDDPEGTADRRRDGGQLPDEGLDAAGGSPAMRVPVGPAESGGDAGAAVEAWTPEAGSGSDGDGSAVSSDEWERRLLGSVSLDLPVDWSTVASDLVRQRPGEVDSAVTRVAGPGPWEVTVEITTRGEDDSEEDLARRQAFARPVQPQQYEGGYGYSFGLVSEGRPGMVITRRLGAAAVTVAVVGPTAVDVESVALRAAFSVVVESPEPRLAEVTPGADALTGPDDSAADEGAAITGDTSRVGDGAPDTTAESHLRATVDAETLAEAIGRLADATGHEVVTPEVDRAWVSTTVLAAEEGRMLFVERHEPDPASSPFNTAELIADAYRRNEDMTLRAEGRWLAGRQTHQLRGVRDGVEEHAIVVGFGAETLVVTAHPAEHAALAAEAIAALAPLAD